MSRRQSREVALKVLFQQEQGGIEPAKALHYCFLEDPLPDSDKMFARRLAEGTLSCLEEIDGIISKYLINWDVRRLAAVDRAVLRLALYEFLYLPDIPIPVTINEAIEMTKKFQDEKSASFVNGLLDKIRKDMVKGEV